MRIQIFLNDTCGYLFTRISIGLIYIIDFINKDFFFRSRGQHWNIKSTCRSNAISQFRGQGQRFVFVHKFSGWRGNIWNDHIWYYENCRSKSICV